MTVSVVAAFNTVRQVVDRPVEQVWTLFQDRSLWMEAFRSSELVGGVENTVGAVSVVRTLSAGAEAARMEEIVHLEPYRRMVVRLWVGGSPMAGQADFQFEPGGESTIITVSIHTFLAEGGEEARNQIERLTQEKITADFAHLAQVARHLI